MNLYEYEQFFHLARSHWWFLGTRAIITDTVQSVAAPLKAPRVLDVGCGAGNVLESLGSGFRRVGLDREMQALQVCREHVSAGLCAGDAAVLPFSDAAFDIVLATDMFEHVENDAAAARECFRVCRPGGVLVSAVPAYPFLYGPHDIALQHFRRYTRNGFYGLLADAGFILERTTYFNALLLPAVAVIRLAQRAFIQHPERYRIRYHGAARRSLLGATLLRGLLLERDWLRRLNLPCGVSLLAVARRPAS